MSMNIRESSSPGSDTRKFTTLAGKQPPNKDIINGIERQKIFLKGIDPDSFNAS